MTPGQIVDARGKDQLGGQSAAHRGLYIDHFQIVHAGEVLAREGAVSERELKMDLVEAKRDSEIEKRKLVVGMFNTVFANTEIRRSVMRNEAVSGTDRGTGQFYNEDRTVNENVTESETPEA